MTERGRLISALRRAHAGERSAALAYIGHARAVADPRHALRIREIARDEWRHRVVLRRLLADLGAAPEPQAEWWRGRLGVVLGFLCAWTGELLPALVAGWLERRGAREYREAERLARSLALGELGDALAHLARAEDRHARWFEALCARRLAPSRRRATYVGAEGPSWTSRSTSRSCCDCCWRSRSAPPSGWSGPCTAARPGSAPTRSCRSRPACSC